MYYVYCGNGCAYSNELYHGRVTNALNNVRREGSKYIEKIKTDWGTRYFYTQDQLNAYYNKAKKGIQDAVGITAKNRYHDAKDNYRHAHDRMVNAGFKSPSKNNYLRYRAAQIANDKTKVSMENARQEYENSLLGRFDNFVTNANMTLGDLGDEVNYYIDQGRARVQSMIKSAQVRVSDFISTARSKVSEYGSAAISKAKSYYEKGKRLLNTLLNKVIPGRAQRRMNEKFNENKDTLDKMKWATDRAANKAAEKRFVGPKQSEVQGPTYQRSPASYVNSSNPRPVIPNPNLRSFDSMVEQQKKKKR